MYDAKYSSKYINFNELSNKYMFKYVSGFERLLKKIS